MRTPERSIAEAVRQRASEAESKRQDRWHRTYNAVLPECMRYWDRRDDVDVDVSEEAHKLAVQCADRVHGVLTP